MVQFTEADFRPAVYEYLPGTYLVTAHAVVRFTLHRGAMKYSAFKIFRGLSQGWLDAQRDLPSHSSATKHQPTRELVTYGVTPYACLRLGGEREFSEHPPLHEALV